MAQSDMLGILQGIKLSDRPALDLSKILHIACGAFPERATPKRSGVMGFHAAPFSNNEEQQGPINPKYFINLGLMPELVGRFPRLGLMSKPDQSIIREIITESVTSPYRQKLWFFQQHGTTLKFDNDALDLLAQMVVEHPTGVRALQLVLTQILSDYEYEITRSDSKSIEEIRFTKDAVAGIADPMIIRSSVTRSNRTTSTSHADSESSDDCSIY